MSQCNTDSLPLTLILLASQKRPSANCACRKATGFTIKNTQFCCATEKGRLCLQVLQAAFLHCCMHRKAHMSVPLDVLRMCNCAQRTSLFMRRPARLHNMLCKNSVYGLAVTGMCSTVIQHLAARCYNSWGRSEFMRPLLRPVPLIEASLEVQRQIRFNGNLCSFLFCLLVNALTYFTHLQ